MKIHFVGCEGVSMKVLARIMKAQGHDVSGSDICLSGHDEKNVIGAQQVVYTCAVGEDNAEVSYAREHNIPVFERAEFLGKIAAQFKHVVAVSGSHGKTTTTGMLGKVFSSLNATVHIGGVTDGESGHIGGNEYFITEACEYKRNFLHLISEVSVVLNVELDHTDYYTDLSDITDAFKVFSSSSRVKIINGDDINSAPLKFGNCITFGLDEGNDYIAKNLRYGAGGYCFDVYEKKILLGEICLSVVGKHNVYNALAAVAAARVYNIKFGIIADGLKNFKGAKRRFERVGNINGAEIFTDYAHHPSELKSTINAARDAGFKYVQIVFEPHTYSRTKSLLNQFADALSHADDILLAPLFAAREAPLEGVSSHCVCRKLIDDGAKAVCCDTFYEAVWYIRNRAQKGAAIIFAGAGMIDKAAHLAVDEDYF